MDLDKYRKQVEAELKTADATSSMQPVGGDVFADKAIAPDDRAAAIQAAPLEELDLLVPKLLDLVRAPDEPAVVRSAAVRALKGAAFLGPRFAPYRPDYLQALRDIVADPDPGLREEVLEGLTAEKDPMTQDLLLNSLKDPATAPLPLAKIIQLLGYDIHAEAAPALRTVAQEATGPAREEALRVLSSDPSSAPLFRELMTDKAQPSIVRRLSATALQNVDPQAFAKVAQEVITDDDDYPEIRATSLSALAHVQELGAEASATFRDEVAKLRDRTTSASLKDSISRFIKSGD